MITTHLWAELKSGSDGRLTMWAKIVRFKKKMESHKPEIILESRESVERYVNGLHQPDIRILLRDRSFPLWDPFEGEKSCLSNSSPTCIRLWEIIFHLWEIIFHLWEIIFPLKGNNFPLIGIIFGHDRIPSTEDIFHFNGSVCGIKFSLKVIPFSVHKHYNVEFYPLSEFIPPTLSIPTNC